MSRNTQQNFEKVRKERDNFKVAYNRLVQEKIQLLKSVKTLRVSLDEKLTVIQELEQKLIISSKERALALNDNDKLHSQVYHKLRLIAKKA